MDKQSGQTDPEVFLGGDVGFISPPHILEMFWKILVNALLGGILVFVSLNDLAALAAP